MQLTNIEENVLLVALDHMEEEILDLMSERTLHGEMWKERLNACKTIRTKIKKFVEFADKKKEINEEEYEDYALLMYQINNKN